MPNARRSLSFTLFVLVVSSAAAFGLPAFLNERTPILTPILDFLGVSPRSLRSAAKPAEDSLVQADASAILFIGSSGAAWLTTTNWTGGVIPMSSQTAQFATNPTGTTPSIGINFANPTNAGTQTNGQRVEEVGAISITSARTNNLTIGNSSSTIGASGTLRPLGVTVNGQDNVIIRHAGSATLTIQNTQGAGNQTMALELVNPTESIINVDGGGTVTISSVIAGGGKNLTIGGTGTGTANTAITNLFAANTYSGNTKVTGNGVLTLAAAGSIAMSPSIEIGGGAGLDVQSLTSAMVLSSGQAIKASGSIATGTIFTSSTKGLTMSSSSPLIFSAFNGATAPLSVSNSGGVLALQPTNPVTVTVAHGGVPLGIGNYKLIAKINSAAGVTGTPSSVTVNGDGIAAGTVASLVNTSGELFLHVAADATAATDFFRSKQTGNWSAVSTWESSHDGVTFFPATAVPDANANTITISPANIVTVDSSTTADQIDIESGGKLFSPGNLNINDGTGDDVTVESGGTFEFGPGTLSNSGQINVKGNLQVDEGGSAFSGTIAYDQTTGTLTFNNSTTEYNVAINDSIWPATNGPQNVSVVGAGGLRLFDDRSIGGTFSYAARVDNAGHLTVNGTSVVNAGGFIGSGAPTYGPLSTLRYSVNTVAPYGRNGEWLPDTISGAGAPHNVQIDGGTKLDLVDGSFNSAFQASGSLNILPLAQLDMSANGGIGTNQPLTVLGSVEVDGTLILSNQSGGDLFVGGDWTRIGTLTTNGRRVTFNGAGAQAIHDDNGWDALSIVGTTARTVTFDAGSTQSVNTDLVLTGASGNLLSLRSSSPGTQWKLHAPSTQNVNFVDAQDSDASGFPEIFALNSVNSFNNVNWRFAQPGSIQLSSATYSANENQGTVTITATRTGGSDGLVRADFADNTGTATGGSSCSTGVDYLQAGAGVFFEWGDGDTSDKSFELTICNDTDIEPDETVNLVVSNPTGGATLGTDSSAVLTIHDDDAIAPPALASFTASPTSGSEADLTAITLTATLDSAPATDTTVNVSVDTGGGITTGDYNLSSATITVAAGETSGTTTFTVVDDSEYEGPEVAHLHAALDSVTKDLNIQIDDNDAPPSTLVVTNTSDADGVCLPGNCSLRQAINSADEGADVSTITFNIAGSGVQTISPATEFSPLVFPTIIDGYTQPGASANTLATGSDAVILIEVDGAGINDSFSNGIATVAQLTVQGMAINDFGRGIDIEGGTGSVIAGNFLGTDASGTTFKGNVVADVLIAAGSHVVGGSAPASRNVLAANGFAIQIVNAGANTVSNNYIGLNAAGDTAIPSGGIILQSSDGNQIGGLTAGERNVIVSAGDGIVVTGNNNVIEGNYIGTDATGANGLLNTGSGVKLLGASTGNTIGGSAAGAGNVIASCGIINSQDAGINFLGDTNNSLFPSGNTVAGNLIGTNAAGTAALGNNRGIDLTNATTNTIGGTTAAARNVISGNILGGVRMQGASATSNILKGNLIGTAVDGASTLANGANAILITSTAASNVIGGTTAGAGNVIAFSTGGAGVRVDDFAGPGNSIVGNSIFSNAAGGIDVGGSGPTANDALDGDTGAGGDDLQNFPIVTSVTGSGSSATISGTLNSVPGQTFSIDVYASASCDTSGFGQGQVYLGRQSTGSTDGNGDTTFNLVSVAIPTGMPVITATATNSAGSTSEFSQCFTISGGTVQFSSATYSVGESGSTATITVTRANGFAGATSVDLATSDGTATGGASCTAGVDYVSSATTLNWGDGDATSRTVVLTICSDAIFEGNETANLALSNAAGGATVGSPSASVLTIVDDDTAFAVDSTDPVDGATNVPNNTNALIVFNRAANTSTITTNTADTSCSGSLQLSNDNFATCVQMAGPPVANGSDTAFTLSPAVPLAGGTTYKTRVTTAAQDTVGNSLPSAFTQSAGFTTVATPTVQFSSSTYKGAEGTIVTISVSRSSTSGTSTVDYATSGLMPTSGACSIGSGSDYRTASGMLTFNDGENAKTFDVTLCSDLLSEDPAESLTLTLSNANGATLGSPSTATLTILDVANQFSQSTPIQLFGSSQLEASPYPSTIDVEGVTGAVNGVRLSLTNVTALDAHNIEILLMSPAGPNQKTYRAMAAVGGNSPLNGATITLEDGAGMQLPQSAAILEGQNYKPTSCADSTVAFPAPAPTPSPSYGDPGCTSVVQTFADVFGGINPNGIWSLYVIEHQGLDRPTIPNGLPSDGSIGGWGIQFLSPTAAPVSVSGRVLTASGRGIRNVKVTISGGDLAEPRTMYTGAFGYYSFTGVTAGQTYFVTVEPKRYTISQPTRVVNMLDSIADLDFVADP